MSISPFLRSPFTDVTGGIHSHQMLGRCQKEEGRYMDCLEAYGLERGKVKCHHLFGDFHECQTSMKQYKRFMPLWYRGHKSRLPSMRYWVFPSEISQYQPWSLDLWPVDSNRLAPYHMGLKHNWQNVGTPLHNPSGLQAMRRERDRQISEGKLKGDNQYVSPKIDSF